MGQVFSGTESGWRAFSSPSRSDGEVAASRLRADGGGDTVIGVGVGVCPTGKTESPPPSRREDAPIHLPIRQAANGEEKERLVFPTVCPFQLGASP